jgi:hypothetical protein
MIKRRCKLFIVRYNINNGLYSIPREEIEWGIFGAIPSQKYFFQAELPFSFSAIILKEKTGLQKIKLINKLGQVIVEMIRKTIDHPNGDIEAYCADSGPSQVFPLESLIIRFRPADDRLTDRGIIYIFPGNPAKMMFCILERSGAILEIVEAAEKAVQDKLAKYFEVKIPW